MFDDESARLCAKAGEGAGVVDVDARTATRGTATLTTTLAATATTAATAATLTAETTLARTSTATAGTATATTETTATLIATAVDVAEVKGGLLLLAPFAGLLTTVAGEEHLLLLALEGLALGELLASTLVGLADLDVGAERSLLLQDLSEVVVIAFDLFLLGSGLSGLGVGALASSSVLLLLGNGVAGDLVGELLGAVVTTPALLDLLGGIAEIVRLDFSVTWMDEFLRDTGAAVTVVTTGTLAAAATTLTTLTT